MYYRPPTRVSILSRNRILELNDILNNAGLLNEKSIGQAVGDIHVVIDLDKSGHAGERQTRHGEDDVISDDEIKGVAQRGVPAISKMLILGQIEIGDDVVIQSNGSALNVVGSIKRDGNQLRLVIITVMRKRDFKPKAGTTPIRVS